MGFGGAGALYCKTNKTEHQTFRKSINSEDPWDLVAGVLCIGTRMKLNIKNVENHLQARTPGIWWRECLVWEIMRN